MSLLFFCAFLCLFVKRRSFFPCARARHLQAAQSQSERRPTKDMSFFSFYKEEKTHEKRHTTPSRHVFLPRVVRSRGRVFPAERTEHCRAKEKKRAKKG